MIQQTCTNKGSFSGYYAKGIRERKKHKWQIRATFKDIQQ